MRKPWYVLAWLGALTNLPRLITAHHARGPLNMSNMSQPTTEKKERSRSKAACQFCRTRKLKCDNLEPECSACRSRSIECVYVQRVAAPRPSNAAIRALQAENRRLRRLLEAHRIDVNEGVLSPDDGSSQMASPIDGRVAAMGAQREEQMRDAGMLCFSLDCCSSLCMCISPH